MWPKLLFDLLPHFARILPVADKYLSTRSASDKAQEAALAALSLELRTEVRTGTDAQAGLLRQMQDQSTQIGDLALDVTRMRMGTEGLELKVARLETSIAAAGTKSALALKLLGVVLAVLLIATALLIALLVRSAH